MTHTFDFVFTQFKTSYSKRWGIKWIDIPISADIVCMWHYYPTVSVSYLLLTKDENPSWFDWVPGWQVLPCAFLRSILVGLPDTITCGPRHAYVMPLFICHSYGQSRRLKNQVERQKKEILFIYLLIFKFLFGKTSHNLQVKDYPRVTMARFRLIKP